MPYLPRQLLHFLIPRHQRPRALLCPLFTSLPVPAAAHQPLPLTAPSLTAQVYQPSRSARQLHTYLRPIFSSSNTLEIIQSP